LGSINVTMSCINITLNDTLVSLPMKRTKAGRLQLGYRNTWFLHGVQDMLDIVADDILQRTMADDDEAPSEATVHLVVGDNHCVLASTIDANVDALAELLERFAHFYDNLQGEEEEAAA
jgi:hypothetical protein